MASFKPKPGGDNTERRLVFIQKLLARGYYDYEIVDACQESCRESEVFRKPSGVPLARDTIRRYLQEARKRIRTTLVNVDEEVQHSLERMRTAYRVAEKKKDVQGMASAQREISRMLGLRREPMADAPFDAAQVHAQLAAMEESVSGGVTVSETPTEGSNDGDGRT